MYKYLLWDIDGTIMDFLAAEKAAIRTLFARYQLGECTDEMLARYSKINKSYWERLERNEMSKEEILVGRFREFFATEGLDVSVAEAFNADYQLELGETVVIRDDALTLIREFKKKHVQAVVTNGTAVAQHKKLSRSGLDQLVDYVMISEKIGVEKPNLDFFTKTFARMGITDPKEVLIIGDSLTSDIRGGNNAGIDTCWYNPTKAINDRGVRVTYEIENLWQLKDIIRGGMA